MAPVSFDILVTSLLLFFIFIRPTVYSFFGLQQRNSSYRFFLASYSQCDVNPPLWPNCLFTRVGLDFNLSFPSSLTLLSFLFSFPFPPPRFPGRWGYIQQFLRLVTFPILSHHGFWLKFWFLVFALKRERTFLLFFLVPTTLGVARLWKWFSMFILRLTMFNKYLIFVYFQMICCLLCAWWQPPSVSFVILLWEIRWGQAPVSISFVDVVRQSKMIVQIYTLPFNLWSHLVVLYHQYYFVYYLHPL
jgi:hypothetical protein